VFLILEPKFKSLFLGRFKLWFEHQISLNQNSICNSQNLEASLLFSFCFWFKPPTPTSFQFSAHLAHSPPGHPIGPTSSSPCRSTLSLSPLGLHPLSPRPSDPPRHEYPFSFLWSSDQATAATGRLSVADYPASLLSLSKWACHHSSSLHPFGFPSSTISLPSSMFEMNTINDATTIGHRTASSPCLQPSKRGPRPPPRLSPTHYLSSALLALPHQASPTTANPLHRRLVSTTLSPKLAVGKDLEALVILPVSPR
jgi:hypothetical protein